MNRKKSRSKKDTKADEQRKAGPPEGRKDTQALKPEIMDAPHERPCY